MISKVLRIRYIMPHDLEIFWDIISSYELGTILCLIVTVNMEFYIIEIIAHANLFSDIICLSMDFISLHFCWHYNFGFLSVSTDLLRFWASQIYSPLQFAAVFSSWTGTHMPVVVKTCSFITATLVSKYLLLCSIRCHHYRLSVLTLYSNGDKYPCDRKDVLPKFTFNSNACYEQLTHTSPSANNTQQRLWVMKVLRSTVCQLN